VDHQLDVQAIHRVRDRLVSRRTAVINQTREFLLEPRIYANARKIARADTYDARIHAAGNTAGGDTASWQIGTGAYVIKAHDQLCLRQYQSNGNGGPNIQFTDGSQTYGVLLDSSSQPMSAATTQFQWIYRTADLTAYAGKTVAAYQVVSDASTPAGTYNLYFGDIAIVSADGTVTSIYDGQQGTVFPNVYNQGQTDISAFEEISDLTGDAEQPKEVTAFYHADQIGSSRLVTAAGGWPMASDIFYPFGDEQTPSPDPNHYKFTSKERDAESGNDYFGARYYASSMGRFLSPDYQDPNDDVDTPLAVPNGALTNPQTLNLYSYVQNNPLSKRDYDGHASWQPCADGSGGQCWTGYYNGEQNNGLFWNSQSNQWQGSDPNPPPDSDPAGMFFTGLTRAMLGQSHGYSQMGRAVMLDGMSMGMKSVAALIPFGRPAFVPADWVEKPLKGGRSNGIKFVDPKNPGNQVLLEQAKPGSSNPGQQADYMKVLRNGQYLDASGNEVPNQSLESHIPQGTELPPDTFGPIP
jgi:RHS repeat-associated protein